MQLGAWTQMGNLAGRVNMMKKVGLIGLLLLHQARSSPGCNPHVDPMKEEEKCMNDLILFMEQKAKVNSSVYCKGMWEDMHCWPPASLGETVSLPCLDIFGRVSKGEVHRNCTSNGWTDLLSLHEDACSYAFNDSLKYLEHFSASHWYFSYVKTMYTIGYTLSLITLAIAITIFCFFSWLLVEGHFLFTLVSRSFFSLKKHLAWSIFLSWGVPFIIIVCWGCAKYFYEDEGCWERRRHEWIWWILRVPVLLSICVNLVFFLGILRILISKLRMSEAHRSEFSQYMKLIKSTFFLVALFGLHCILFVFLPVNVSNSVFKIWTFAELALSSTQGFVVAVLYCFMNGEVQQEFKRRWKRWKLTRHLPSRSRQHHGSISQIGSPHTQVSLLPSSPTSLTNTGFPADTLEM
ncbi:secretin receptor isoform X2 [Xiphophorus hellerii]|uniref:secretin receptor isoform X2 n=1 Tax=Xiphophorus hellerii TaxID=8084 RepID=UPI0013B403BF|nr:vasoactive intestinal polypeptide receptor-like isoform X2 [Xiphophorus hellerii]